MEDQMQDEYYVLHKRAVPDVLLKVVEAKRFLESRKAGSVQQAAEMAGISRSSFYKYKEDIFPFRDSARGKAITLLFQMEDIPGILSSLLQTAANFRTNIITINQNIPVNGVASLTLTLEVRQNAGDPAEMVERMRTTEGVLSVQILARE